MRQCRDRHHLHMIARRLFLQKFPMHVVTIWPASSSHERTGTQATGENGKSANTCARTRIHPLAGSSDHKDGQVIRAKTSLAPANLKTLLPEPEEASPDPQENARFLRPPYPEATSVILSLPPGVEAKRLLHPTSGYAFIILRGALTVELQDGARTRFKSMESAKTPQTFVEMVLALLEGRFTLLGADESASGAETVDQFSELHQELRNTKPSKSESE